MLDECGSSGKHNHIFSPTAPNMVCSGSASVPRGYVYNLISANGSLNCPPELKDVIEMKGLPLPNCTSASTRV